MSMEELKIFKVTGEPAMSIIAEMKSSPARMKEAHLAKEASHDQA